MKNKVSINIPKTIKGYGDVISYEKTTNTVLTSKVKASIKAALQAIKVKDKMTVSFHHHLRNGDYVLNMVIAEFAKLGIKDLTIVASSLTNAHEPLLEHIKNGVVTSLQTSGLRGEIAKEISKNAILKQPVIFRSHGGRVRAIENGEVAIDIAFIATPMCDTMGNLNGMEGVNAFGAISYAMVDAKYAKHVVAITDNLVEFPINNISISMIDIDYVVKVDAIGDSSKIATGATRVTDNPMELLIAKRAAEVLIATGQIKTGFSFQAGGGGPSLAVCKYLRKYMEDNQIVGSFVSGGVTNYLVGMLEDGLFNVIFDAQTFDNMSAKSLLNNPNHIEMSTSMYANLANKGCIAHQLDFMILACTEIDLNFNLNSLTTSSGVIMGAVGGAQDTAFGAKITVVVAPSMRSRLPIVVDQVTHIVTPGNTVDILVTDRGVCVNPNRSDLADKLVANGIEVKDIKQLQQEILAFTKAPAKNTYQDTIVGVIEYRDGTVIDVIKQIESK